jgi:hypothetical protein
MSSIPKAIPFSFSDFRTSVGISSFDEKGNRTVIDERNLHICLKDSLFYRNSERSGMFAERNIEFFSLIRRGSIVETWPSAMLAIAVEGELADDQELALYIDDRPVHLPLIVCESSQMDTLLCEPFRSFEGITFSNAKQNEPAGSDLSDHPIIDFDASMGHSLKQSPHLNGSTGIRCC